MPLRFVHILSSSTPLHQPDVTGSRTLGRVYHIDNVTKPKISFCLDEQQINPSLASQTSECYKR